MRNKIQVKIRYNSNQINMLHVAIRDQKAINTLKNHKKVTQGHAKSCKATHAAIFFREHSFAIWNKFCSLTYFITFKKLLGHASTPTTTKSTTTRPNEFGSMTARKDDTSPVKSIFCHKRP